MTEVRQQIESLLPPQQLTALSRATSHRIPYASVICSMIQPDHSLSPWQEAESLNHTATYHADTWNGRIYVTGDWLQIQETNAVR